MPMPSRIVKWQQALINCHLSVAFFHLPRFNWRGASSMESFLGYMDYLRMSWVLKFSPRNTLEQNLYNVICANVCTFTARLIPVASHIWVLDPWIWMWVHEVVHRLLLCAQQFPKHIHSGKAKQFCCHVYSWLIWGILSSVPQQPPYIHNQGNVELFGLFFKFSNSYHFNLQWNLCWIRNSTMKH